MSAEENASTNLEVAPAAEVGKAVQEALKNAMATGLAGLQLEKATLTLETGRSVEGTIELSLFIFTISAKKKKQSTLTQTLVFGPFPEEAAIQKLEDLTEPLARAIASAALTAAQIDALPLTQATIKIEFAVEWGVGGKIGFQVVSVDVGGGIDFSKTSKNGLELEFVRKVER